MKLLTALLTISLSAIGCAKLPPFPEVYQCVYAPKLGIFRCANSRTKEKISLRLDDPKMDKALCLSIDDYKKSQEWVSTVKSIAEKNCN